MLVTLLLPQRFLYKSVTIILLCSKFIVFVVAVTNTSILIHFEAVCGWLSGVLII